MQARYYDPVIGRFYSNDPDGKSSWANNPVLPSATNPTSLDKAAARFAGKVVRRTPAGIVSGLVLTAVLNESSDGEYQQVRAKDGKQTGSRLDKGGHKGQSDPKAQGPHAHQPGVTGPDGNPHLPIKPPSN